MRRAAVLLLLAGCSSSSSPPPEPVARGPDDSFLAIVSPNEPSFVCSATAIAPRVILSAAHCFVGGNYDKTGWSFAVVVTVDVHHPQGTDRRFAVTEFHLQPDYQSLAVRADGGDGDIAIALV